MAHDLVTELLLYSSLACFMPIWQLCANLLIPNCLRSNLSYSPLATLELYVNVDMSWGFHNIHIIPNPITALYYYEIVTEETTVKESLQIIDEIAKQKISSGWCRDRAHFFKTYGFEGEYWGSYMGRFEKLEPGIYKVVVVGVDAKTGEYNSVVAFSEPFKTEEY